MSLDGMPRRFLVQRNILYFIPKDTGKLSDIVLNAKLKTLVFNRQLAVKCESNNLARAEKFLFYTFTSLGN